MCGHQQKMLLPCVSSSFLDGSGSVWNERGVPDALHTDDCSRPCAGCGAQDPDLQCWGEFGRAIEHGASAEGAGRRAVLKDRACGSRNEAVSLGLGWERRYIQLFDLHLCSSGGVWILCIVFIKNKIVQQVGSHQWKVYQCHKELNSIFFLGQEALCSTQALSLALVT